MGAARLLLSLLVLAAAPEPSRAGSEVTLFVTSESTDTVTVFRGPVPHLVPVASIRVGREPHNLAVSPDGRWAAVSNRRGREVSVIDTARLQEVARLRVGHQPHDLVFTADSRTLYVADEAEPFISVVEVGPWRVGPPLRVGRAQHDLAITPDDRELWFTVTNRPYRAGDPRVGIVALDTKRVTLLDTGANAHDVILSPDGTQAWVTNSGFTHIPDARVDILDVSAPRRLASITVGRYPFHAPKRGRDGNLVPPGASEMWFTDHGLRAVVAVSIADRRVVASVPVGVRPYHVAATAEGTLFVANHGSGTVTIVDGPRRAALGTLRVPPHPHGLAVVAERGR